jgi:solute carrier family 25 carnitine/acylcarnitine transporter 20/29
MSDQASDLERIEAESKSTVDPVKSFLSGGFGGISCVLVGHPFDLTSVSLLPPGFELI